MSMNIAICQINPVIGDFEYNIALMMEGIENAKKKRASLVIFPEMSLLGYPPKDLLEKPSFIKENLKQLEKFASTVSGIHVLCGYVERNPVSTGKPLINGVALISDRRVVHRGGKRLLPTYDVFDEARYFEPATESLIFEVNGRRIGVTICEDIWNVGDLEGIPRYPLDPVSEIMERGIDILVNISASPYAINKRELRRNILVKLSTQYRVPTVFCNQVGGNDELLFDGSSMVVDANGKLILAGREFESDGLIWDSERDYDEVCGPWPALEESIINGLILGTRDYICKCGFSKALVGLSGGIDSSLVAVIAARAMGPENVTGVSMPLTLYI